MSRATPWLLLLVCAVVGGGLWAYRANRSHAEPAPHRAVSAEEEVRNAWTLGRQVPLRGLQEVRMPGPKGWITVDAEVVASADGKMRIKYLGAPLRNVTVWENGDRTYRFNPRLERISVAIKRVGRPRPEVRVLENYETSLLGTETVAGRTAKVIELNPRSGDRNRRKIWVDAEKWVILRSEELDQQGRLRRRSSFTTIQFLSQEEQPAPSEFVPPADMLEKYGDAIPGDSSGRFEPEGLSEILGFPVLQPTWLPEGYRFQGAYQARSFCGSGQGARLEYTDGLNALTVFECGGGDCPQGATAARDASTAAYRRQGNVHYLAVGELPKPQLERIVESIR